jgi:PKD repeat protein
LARRPVHVYREPGAYTAVVTVTDPGGASSTAEVDVTVEAPPANGAPQVEAAAAPASGVAPLSVLLSAQGTDPDGDRLTYSWTLGDGATADRRNVRHTYTESGTFTAIVTATDSHGATGTAEVEIVVGDPPGNQAPTVQVAADPSSGTAPLRVRFSAAGSDPDGDELSHVWEFGDGGMAGGPRATHVYTQPGTYTATVTVSDASGATGTASVQVVVSAPAAPPRIAAPSHPVAAPEARGDVAGEQATALATVRAPGSVRALLRRGARVTVNCVAGGDGRAVLKVARKAARRIGLRKRTLAVRKVDCTAGQTANVRLRPRKAARRKLRGERAIRLVLRVRVEGAERVTRRLMIR